RSLLQGMGEDGASLAPADRAAGRLNPIAVTAKPAVLRPEGPRYDQTDRLRPTVSRLPPHRPARARGKGRALRPRRRRDAVGCAQAAGLFAAQSLRQAA